MSLVWIDILKNEADILKNVGSQTIYFHCKWKKKKTLSFMSTEEKKKPNGFEITP